MALFPAKTDLFVAYGIGLFAGFFSYFAFLMLWVRISKNFTVDWFLDGRRRKPSSSYEIPEDARTTGSAMSAPEDADFE